MVVGGAIRSGLVGPDFETPLRVRIDHAVLLRGQRLLFLRKLRFARRAAFLLLERRLAVERAGRLLLRQLDLLVLFGARERRELLPARGLSLGDAEIGEGRCRQWSPRVTIASARVPRL